MKNTSPKWLENALFYEIYPQSFQDTNDDGIGDFQGIINRLEYIMDLGANAIWINPCFDSPFGDAGYDVSDYYKVAPRYGTNDDLERLFNEAHKIGLHVLLDLVPGHTSTEHPWFLESKKAAHNEYSDRYIWTDSVWTEPKGYGSLRGISDRNGSCIVNFFSHQPALNYGFYEPKESWQMPMDAEGPMKNREEIKNILKFWFEKGCDGFRVDMAGSLVKDDPEGKGTIMLWQDIRKFLDESFPDKVLISEWGEPDKSIKAGFHMDFLLHFGPSHYNDLFRCDKPFFAGNGNAFEFVEKYKELYKAANKEGLICIPSGNHDMDRLTRSIPNDILEISYAFLLSMPGVPFIYYGDEIGMRYVEGLISKEGGYSRTGSRSPMQWDDTKNAGFSGCFKNELYIPLDKDINRPNAKKELNDPESIRSKIKNLITIRNNNQALKNSSEIDFIYSKENEYPLAYLRYNSEDRILVILNPSSSECSFECDFTEKETIYLFGEKSILNGKKCIVPAKSAQFIRV